MEGAAQPQDDHGGRRQGAQSSPEPRCTPSRPVLTHVLPTLWAAGTRLPRGRRTAALGGPGCQHMSVEPGLSFCLPDSRASGWGTEVRGVEMDAGSGLT